MLLFAGLCILIGVAYEPLYAILPFPAAAGETLYEPYTLSHVVSQLQLLLWSGLAFFLLLPVLKRTLTITLDFDWIWRSFIPWLWRGILQPIVTVMGWFRDVFFIETKRFGAALTKPETQASQGGLFREWSLGGAMVLLTFMLFIFLIVGFLD
ncbi:MAG TPA: hypothetical protein ENK31_06375 [Nannocystis exedens]|nr:hypothetical protein [Nannocystis exedens]